MLFYPRPLVEDMEELRRSPAAAVIRMNRKMDLCHLRSALQGLEQFVKESARHRDERTDWLEREIRALTEELYKLRVDVSRMFYGLFLAILIVLVALLRG